LALGVDASCPASDVVAGTAVVADVAFRRLDCRVQHVNLILAAVPLTVPILALGAVDPSSPPTGCCPSP
jgi:hypothetical protein